MFQEVSRPINNLLYYDFVENVIVNINNFNNSILD